MKEVFKLHPSFAYNNPSAAIIFIRTMMGIGTTLFHRIPCSINSNTPQSMFKAPFFPARSLACTLSLITATRFCMATTKKRAINNFFFTTPATTKPGSSLIIIYSGKSQDNKPPKFLAAKINNFRHFYPRFFNNIFTPSRINRAVGIPVFSDIFLSALI